MNDDKVRLAVLYGGTSAEHEVSVLSARSFLEAVDRTRYEVIPIAITKSGRWLLPKRPPDKLPPVQGVPPAVEDGDGEAITLRHDPGAQALVQASANGGVAAVDVVFPLLHGPGGEDGTVQGLLELLGIPYVGAGVAASAVGMNKALQKPVFANAGIPVAPWIDVRSHEFEQDVQGTVMAARDFIGLPCFTKPANMGSSVGVNKCRTVGDLIVGLTEAFEHDRIALVEKAIDGRELECAVLGNNEPLASVVGEVVPGREFYDYKAKYVEDTSGLIIPADIPPDVSTLIRDYAVRAFQAVDCAGMARVDFFYDTAGQVWINEINTIPGFTPISMFPKLWEASGVGYRHLIDRLIELAFERHGVR